MIGKSIRIDLPGWIDSNRFPRIEHGYFLLGCYRIYTILPATCNTCPAVNTLLRRQCLEK